MGVAHPLFFEAVIPDGFRDQAQAAQRRLPIESCVRPQRLALSLAVLRLATAPALAQAAPPQVSEAMLKTLAERLSSDAFEGRAPGEEKTAP